MLRSRASLFAILSFASLLSAAGVYFFRLPNHFCTGGTSGMGILLGELMSGVSAGTYISVLSLVFVLVGFIFLGKEFGWLTVYCSVLFAVFLQMFEWLFPLSGPLTNQKMLELVFASVLPAASSALMLNQGASAGGTEVLALILRKYTVLDTGKALLCVDIVFAVSTFFFFDLETGLYSCLGLFVKATLLDSVLQELQRKKAMLIITEKPNVVLDYILIDIHRGATVWEAKGAYSGAPRRVVLTVMNRSESMRLIGRLKKIDPGAFVLSENSSEIYGKGFVHIGK